MVPGRSAKTTSPWFPRPAGAFALLKEEAGVKPDRPICRPLRLARAAAEEQALWTALCPKGRSRLPSQVTSYAGELAIDEMRGASSLSS